MNRIELIYEAINQNKDSLIIKGNPNKQFNKETTKKFYNDLESILKSKNFKVKFIESDKKITDQVDDVMKYKTIIVFSRGGLFPKIIRTAFDKRKEINIIGIGCDDYARGNKHFNLSLTNPNDKVLEDDFSNKSLKAHWTLTNEMKNKIRNSI